MSLAELLEQPDFQSVSAFSKWRKECKLTAIEEEMKREEERPIRIETVRHCYKLACDACMEAKPGESELEAISKAFQAYIKELEQ